METDFEKKGKTGKKFIHLKDEVWEMCDVLFVAQENLRCLSYLHKEENDPDKNFYKRRSMYFDFTKKMTWRLVVLELCKLFNDTEDFSIRKLLAKLKPGGLHQGIIPANNIQAWEKVLDGHKDIIKRLKTQRNKSIAHKDRTGLNHKINGVSLKQANDLLAFIQNIVKEIYFKVTGTTFMVDSPVNSPAEDLDKIICSLAKERKASLAPLMDEAKRYGLTNF